jgi:proteasome lid subunit RPN8/RPN11
VSENGLGAEREGLGLARPIAQEMIAHCEDGRPHEACGILGARGGAVVRVFRMTNAAHSPLRYSLDPKEQLLVYRTLDEEGLELGGVFHSHTHTDAYPSPTDIRLASEAVPYLIVSLAAEPPVIRAYRILKDNWDDPGGEVVEVSVTVEG